MDNLAIIKDAFRIFLTTKLVWVFIVFKVLSVIIDQIIVFARNQPVLYCLLTPLYFATGVITVIATSGLIYLVNQVVNKKTFTFNEIWIYCRARFFRIIGLGLLFIPAIIVFLILYFVLINNAPNSVLLGLLVLILYSMLYFTMNFGDCALIVDDNKVSVAAWAGIRLTFKNLTRVFYFSGLAVIFHLLIIGLLIAILTSGIFKYNFSIPVLFDFPTYQKLISEPVIATTNKVLNLFLVPFYSIVITLCYLEFKKKDSVPEIEMQQPPA